MYEDSHKAPEELAKEHEHQMRSIDEKRDEIRQERARVCGFEADFQAEAKACRRLLEDHAIRNCQDINCMNLAEEADDAINGVFHQLHTIEEDLLQNAKRLAALEDEMRRDFNRQCEHIRRESEMKRHEDR